MARGKEGKAVSLLFAGCAVRLSIVLSESGMASAFAAVRIDENLCKCLPDAKYHNIGSKSGSPSWQQ